MMDGIKPEGADEANAAEFRFPVSPWFLRALQRISSYNSESLL